MVGGSPRLPSRYKSNSLSTHLGVGLHGSREKLTFSICMSVSHQDITPVLGGTLYSPARLAWKQLELIPVLSKEAPSGWGHSCYGLLSFRSLHALDTGASFRDWLRSCRP